MKIIVVDDKEEERYLAEILLKKSGYEVKTAADGAEALAKLRTERFDLIISDILMPVMDGFQFCQECKRDEKLKDIPFIFYTATYKDRGDEKLALGLGAEKFLRKPLEPDEFIKMIQGVVKDIAEGRASLKKPVEQREEEVFKLYSESLVRKLEKKMLDLEAETTRRKLAQERVEDLNRVLRAIRNVNQLIVREKERDKLLKDACAILTRTRGYDNTGIYLFDESRMLITHAEAGLDSDFSSVVEQLKRGEITDCINRTLVQSGLVVTEASPSVCGDCPLLKMCRGKKVMTIQIEHGGKVYGLLNLQLSGGFLILGEEQSLLEEVAGDIAFALHDMELQEERGKMEDALRESEQTYRTLAERLAEGVYQSDLEGNYITLNKAGASIMGFDSPEEVIGKYRTVDFYYDLSERAKIIEDIRRNGFSVREVRAERRDGTVIWLLVNNNARLDEHGNIIGYEGVFADITAVKQAAEERRQSAEKLIRAMEATIEAMALTVEMRDPYTAGHQRRVTEFAVAIARELSLSEDKIGGIRVAGIIHDIGKIRVPAEILSKPGRLDEMEFGMIKTHPQVGYDILKTIEFPWPIATAVVQHHERMNGSGYPAGLSGEDIILEARVLAVADVVEAMASHRPYRPALSMEKALEEISQNRGILYDASVVDSCLRFVHDQGFKFN